MATKRRKKPRVFKLGKAFSEMRKQGLLARQDFLCCGNCAGYAMTEKAVELIKKGRSKEAILGCAFYHRQDAQRRDEGHDFHISYGPMESKEFDMIGRSAKEVGHIVCKALLKHEIKFEWDGNPDTRILIKAGSWQ